MAWKNKDGIAECLSDGIIFHSHIPKTAGTSIHKAFKNALEPEQFVHWNPVNPYNMTSSIKELEALLEEKKDLKFITGHYMYGVHAALKGRPFKYVSVMRDPLARAFSHYKHAIQRNFLHLDKEKIDAIIDLSLPDFLRRPDISFFYTNLQTRFISGLSDPSFDGLSSDEIVALCVNNIKRDYCFLGSQASLSAAIRDLSEMFELDSLEERTDNARGRVDPRTLFPKDQVDDILEQNSLDMRLIEQFCPETIKDFAPTSAEEGRLSDVMLESYKIAVQLLLRRIRKIENSK